MREFGFINLTTSKKHRGGSNWFFIFYFSQPVNEILVLGLPILVPFVFFTGVDAPLDSSSKNVSSPALKSRSTLDGLRAGVESSPMARFDFLVGFFFCVSSSSAFRFNCCCNLSSSSSSSNSKDTISLGLKSTCLNSPPEITTF